MSGISRRSLLGAAVVAPISLALAKPLFAASEPPKFKLGLVTYQVGQSWDLKSLLDVCKRAGIAAIEARTTHKHGIEPSMSASQRADAKKQFADSGVVFWGCGSVCEFHSDDAAVVQANIESCKQFLKLTADLGGKGVKVRPNGITKGKTIEQTCDQIGKALIECGKAAADLGLDVSVEVHGKTTQEPKNMKLIMDACAHPSVGVTWNSNNTDVDKDSGSIAKNFELLAKHIRSCHINDLERDKAGTYPYRELFKLLKGIGYDRYTMIEYSRKKNFDPKEGEEFLKKYKELWTELAAG